MLATETVLYDDLSKGRIDPSKWKLLSIPLSNGQVWTYVEPKARIEPREGGLALTVDPFTRKHDQVHMFDDPKQLYVSTRTFPVSRDGTTVFEVEMAAETYRSNAEDLGDAFAGFVTADISTGMIFDLVSSGKKIGAIYERLLIPGLTDEKTAFTYLIESPFSGISTSPDSFHQYSVRLNARERKAEWYVDSRPFFKAEGVPVQLGEITLGFGLFTLKSVDPVRGSLSVHGQGATGMWRNFKYTPG